jgi:hypothetical protein
MLFKVLGLENLLAPWLCFSGQSAYQYQWWMRDAGEDQYLASGRRKYGKLVSNGDFGNQNNNKKK